MRNINKTNTIGSLLNETVFSDKNQNLKLAFVVKQSTIFSFWNDIVGVKFAKYTKPVAIKYSKLYISARSPVLVQEMNLFKSKIIKKVNTYSNPLGITIKDIIFDYKNYAAAIKKEDANYCEDKPVWISEGELKEVEIDKKVEDDIKEHISKIKFLNENQKKDFIEKIVTVYKAKEFKNCAKNHWTKK